MIACQIGDSDAVLLSKLGLKTLAASSSYLFGYTLLALTHHVWRKPKGGPAEEELRPIAGIGSLVMGMSHHGSRF